MLQRRDQGLGLRVLGSAHGALTSCSLIGSEQPLHLKQCGCQQRSRQFKKRPCSILRPHPAHSPWDTALGTPQAAGSRQ